MSLREEVSQERKRIREEKNKMKIKDKEYIDKLFARHKIKEKINDKISNEKNDLVKSLAENDSKQYEIQIIFRIPKDNVCISNKIVNKKLKEIFAEIEDEYINYIIIDFEQENELYSPKNDDYKTIMVITWKIRKNPDAFDDSSYDSSSSNSSSNY